jgi:hypothetical protein
MTGCKLLLELIAPQYFSLLLLKLLSDGLNFVVPLVLGELVPCIASSPLPPTEEDVEGLVAGREIAGRVSDSWFAPERQCKVQWSIFLAAVLFVVAVMKACLDSQYCYHMNRMSIRAAGMLMQAPLPSYLRKPAYLRQQFTAGTQVLHQWHFHCMSSYYFT